MITTVKPTVVITVSRKELAVAQHSGLVVPHPIKNRMILWAPSGSFDDLPTDCDHIITCTVTKHTESDLKKRSITYRNTDPDYNITFELEEGEQE